MSMPIYLYFPYAYFLKTRLISRVQQISWFFVYFVPTFTIFFYFCDFVFSANNLLLYFTSLLLINYIYENGYIQNDVLLTKSETNPTLRLGMAELLWCRDNILTIFLVRFFISLFLLAIVFFLAQEDFNLFVFVGVVFLLQALYFIYNSTRSFLNLLLILPLSYLRFFGFVLPIVTINDWFEFIIASLLIYPLSKFLEFTKESKYNLERIASLIGSIDLFRVKYYLVVSFILFILFYFYNWSISFLIITIYYFVFRLAAFLVLSKNSKFKQAIKKNTKKGFR